VVATVLATWQLAGRQERQRGLPLYAVCARATRTSACTTTRAAGTALRTCGHAGRGVPATTGPRPRASLLSGRSRGRTRPKPSTGRTTRTPSAGPDLSAACRVGAALSPAANASGVGVPGVEFDEDRRLCGRGSGADWRSSTSQRPATGMQPGCNRNHPIHISG
jgi:hypothetical protein